MSTVSAEEINEAYFNACNFESLLRGIHFAVLLTALSNIFTSKRSSSSRSFMVLIILALFVMSTMHSANYWAYIRRAFIAHGETRQSIADALNEYPDWYIGIASVSDGNAILADCVIIWRCWIVWGRSWKSILIPVISAILTTAFSIIAIYSTFASTTFGAVGVDYATALYSTSLATTLYCTGAIVYRVIEVGTRSRQRMAAFRSYRAIIEILVESSALYCIATLFALIAYIRSGPASEFASAFWTSITGIAPTLIVARVASGEARPDDSWSASTRASGVLSFFQFNKPEETSTPEESWNGTEAMTGITAFSDEKGVSPTKYRDSETRSHTSNDSNV